MRMLILGGTGFIGRHLCREALSRGHQVTLLARGKTVCELPSGVQLLIADRNDPASCLKALQNYHFDCCVDTSSYRPDQLEPIAAWFSQQSPQPYYLFISAVMVYGDCHERPVKETASLLEAAKSEVREIDGESYGTLKVACEAVLPLYFPGNYGILRPQTIVGPEDPTGRLAYWLNRALQPRPSLAPGDGNDHVQVLDVHDLVRFLCTMVEQRVANVFHLGGERISWSNFVSLLGLQEPVWVPAGLLEEQGITFSELPLFRPERGLHAGLMDLDCSKAFKAGFGITRLAETLKVVRESMVGDFRHTFLTKDGEAMLLELLNKFKKET